MKTIKEVLVFSLCYIYIIPPLLFRFIQSLTSFEEGTFKIADRQLLFWWYGAQLQLLYSRMPFLEECLRIPPFLYSAWLRLWGAKIGKLVYWSPRVEILDRNLIEIGDRALIGYGVKFTSHLINKEKFFLAKVKVGNDALIGGETRLAPGCEVESHSTVPALSVLRPLSKFTSDKKHI